MTQRYPEYAYPETFQNAPLERQESLWRDPIDTSPQVKQIADLSCFDWSRQQGIGASTTDKVEAELLSKPLPGFLSLEAMTQRPLSGGSMQETGIAGFSAPRGFAGSSIRPKAKSRATLAAANNKPSASSEELLEQPSPTDVSIRSSPSEKAVPATPVQLESAAEKASGFRGRGLAGRRPSVKRPREGPRAVRRPSASLSATSGLATVSKPGSKTKERRRIGLYGLSGIRPKAAVRTSLEKGAGSSQPEPPTSSPVAEGSRPSPAAEAERRAALEATLQETYRAALIEQVAGAHRRALQGFRVRMDEDIAREMGAAASTIQGDFSKRRRPLSVVMMAQAQHLREKAELLNSVQRATSMPVQYDRAMSGVPLLIRAGTAMPVLDRMMSMPQKPVGVQPALPGSPPAEQQRGVPEATAELPPISRQTLDIPFQGWSDQSGEFKRRQSRFARLKRLIFGGRTRRGLEETEEGELVQQSRRRQAENRQVREKFLMQASGSQIAEKYKLHELCEVIYSDAMKPARRQTEV